MSKAEPTIQKFMTTQPYSIEAGQKLEEAQELMKKYKIRHLPVVKGDSVVGILSDRDIKLASGFEGVDSAQVVVADMCAKPYTVSPDSPLADVAEEMASKHYGSAVVVQNGKLVGIFTTVDACRAIHTLIRTRHHGE